MRTKSLYGFMNHVTKTSAYQHGGNRMPSVEEDEEFEKQCYEKKKRLEEAMDVYRKSKDYVEGMMPIDGKAFCAIKKRLSSNTQMLAKNLKDAVRIAYRYGDMDIVKEMLKGIVKSVREKPKMRNRCANYFDFVKWHKEAKKLLGVSKVKFGIE